MSRRMLGTIALVFLLAVPAFADDRDPDSRSVQGIPKGHKHMWAVIGGAALGAGLGAIPGGASNVFKGAFIGGGGASALYLAKHRGQEGPWSYVITNAAWAAGLGWAICDCGAGFGAGALVGGGGTALVQAFKTKNRPLAAVTGAGSAGTDNPPPPQSEPPQVPPPATQPPSTQPPSTQPPVSQPPPPAQTPPPDQTPPDNQAPHDLPDLTNPQ